MIVVRMIEVEVSIGTEEKIIPKAVNGIEDRIEDDKGSIQNAVSDFEEGIF